MPKKKIILSGIVLVLMGSYFVFFNKEEASSDIVKARVENITSQKIEAIPGAKMESLIQEISATIISGEDKGKAINFTNDFSPLEKGDKIFLLKSFNEENEVYGVIERDRTAGLLFIIFVFVLILLTFSGKQGLRSVLSLIGGILTIMFILLPLLKNGASPVSTSIFIASIILCIAIFVTHGINKRSLIAFLGTTGAVVLTGIFAEVFMNLLNLTGFSSHEAVYLNINNGALDIQGLLLAGIIIGVLGVIDDIAITQTAIVSELKSINKNMDKKEIYSRAIRIGREHISALVNTLALAYTGASLPLLLLFSGGSAPFGLTASREIFATEILRTIVGSIGLILTVPITTLLAVYILKGNEKMSENEHHHIH